MVAAFRKLHTHYFPPVPGGLADEFDLFRAARLRNQCSMLLLGMLITIPTAIYGASDGASFWVHTVLPVFIAVLFLICFASLQKIDPAKLSPRQARKFIIETTWSSPIVGILCSAWCVVSWWTADDAMRAYYPLILSMGSLATAYCLSSVRLAAILNIVVGLLPISLLMFFSGNRMDFAASVSLLMASVFLLRMIFDQHQQWIDLLQLQADAKELAHTDPLTGLFNRRAFDLQLKRQLDDAPAAGFAIALFDLDGFKPVNDRHGHAVGDALLREIGMRLEDAFVGRALVARLGGDEFGIILADADVAATDAALLALVKPCELMGHPIRVGASMGVACWPNDGGDADALMASADQRLYAAKAENRRLLAGPRPDLMPDIKRRA
jgi:diguanylate cyclase